MTALDQFALLAREVQRFAGVTTEITPFPSGAVSLEVRIRDRMFEIAYFPSHACYCVDEVLEEDGFGTGYRFGFDDFEPARAKLISLVTQP